jgi:hypothetical protein
MLDAILFDALKIAGTALAVVFAVWACVLMVECIRDWWK